MHGVPAVKSILHHVRDGLFACSWISPKADLCPHWDKNHLSSVYFCTLKHKNWGQSLVPAIQVVGGNMEKCPYGCFCLLSHI